MNLLLTALLKLDCNGFIKVCIKIDEFVYNLKQKIINENKNYFQNIDSVNFRI